METNPLTVHPLKYAGDSVETKLERIREEMTKKEANFLLVSKLEEIAWTLNIRGADEPYSPIFISYLLVGMDSAVLFVEKAKMTDEVQKQLKSAEVEIEAYSEALNGVKTALSNNKKARIWLDPDLVSHAIFKTAKEVLGPEKVFYKYCFWSTKVSRVKRGSLVKALH